MTDQIKRLRRLAAEAARDAVMPAPEDYRIHALGKEIRAKLKAVFPATNFYIASADGFDSMFGEWPPTINLRWNDAPSRNALEKTLRELIEQRRSEFDFEMVVAHGFTCRTCGGAHGATLADKPIACPDISDGLLW